MPYLDKARKAANRIAWTAKNPIRARWLCLRGNAKKRLLNIDLEYIDFQTLVTQPCVYCNDRFRKPNEMGGGLDRIDNSKGYELDNVLSCCGFCNSVRSDVLTVDETKAAIAAVIQFRASCLET